MTDKVFYHPETGKPLHPVPEGATIPAGTPYGYEDPYDEEFHWVSRGEGAVSFPSDLYPHFTAEPIAPPVPPLPTEPGSLIRATSLDGATCEVMMLWAGSWISATADGHVHSWWPGNIAAWEPLRVEPNGHGVLDEHDKRPVVDSLGYAWEWDEAHDLWVSPGLWSKPPRTAYRGTKAAIDRKYGPLRLAGGSAS